MKNKKLKLLSSASAAAMALSFSPLLTAQTQSSAGSYNQSATQSSNAQDANNGSSSYSSDQNSNAQPQDNAGSAVQQQSSANTNAGMDQNAASAQMNASSATDNAGSASQFNAFDSGSASLRVASKDESKRTVEKLAGKKLRSQDGKELGKVKDFLIDPKSGDVRYAVISVGGFIGVGDKLHLVPFQQLQESDKDFTTSMTKEQLDQTPVLNEEKFEEDQVSLNAQQNQEDSSMAMNGPLLRATKIKSHDVKANGQKIGSIKGLVIESGSHQAVALLEPKKDVAGTDQNFLVPLSRFTFSGKKDKDVSTTLTRADFQSASNATASASTTTGGNTMNANVSSEQQSQNVAADTTAGTAAPAALGASGSTTQADEQTQTASNSTQTTSPLSNASGAQQSNVATNQGSSAQPGAQDTNGGSSTSAATAQDQQSGVASDQTSSSNLAAQNQNTNTPGLTATGETSAQQNPSASSSMISAAQSVRRALDSDPSVSRADVQVVPQNDRIELVGNVGSQSLKSKIEKKAKSAANGVQIDSKLQVQ